LTGIFAKLRHFGAGKRRALYVCIWITTQAIPETRDAHYFY
jgi:hypothetical protein